MQSAYNCIYTAYISVAHCHTIKCAEHICKAFDINSLPVDIPMKFCWVLSLFGMWEKQATEALKKAIGERVVIERVGRRERMRQRSGDEFLMDCSLVYPHLPH